MNAFIDQYAAFYFWLGVGTFIAGFLALMAGLAANRRALADLEMAKKILRDAIALRDARSAKSEPLTPEARDLLMQIGREVADRMTSDPTI